MSKAHLFVTYANAEDGIEVEVWLVGSKFHVVLVDTEAGEAVPSVKIFDNDKDACDYAELCAG